MIFSFLVQFLKFIGSYISAVPNPLQVITIREKPVTYYTYVSRGLRHIYTTVLVTGRSETGVPMDTT